MLYLLGLSLAPEINLTYDAFSPLHECSRKHDWAPSTSIG